MSRARFSTTSNSAPLTVATVAMVSGVAAVVCSIAADARWLAALGASIVRNGTPDGVPYASAPTAGWENVPVLSELLFYGAHRAGSERAFLLAQLVAVAACFAVLRHVLFREGATDASVAAIVLAVAIGAIPALVVVRVQLFSLVLFPLLLAVVYRDASSPSRRVWLLVPLVALWSNLHGAVLAGVAFAGAYLLLARARRDPLTGIGVTLAMVAAVCATPALWRTPAYYAGVLGNESARQGVGLWAPLSPTLLDALLVAAVVGLGAAALRGRPQLWELVALAGLAVLTLRTARAGVWLLLALAVPAARGLRLDTHVRARVGYLGLGLGVLLVAVALIRGPVPTGAGDRVLHRALVTAAGTPILAEPVAAEQVALAGGSVWVSNPLDAFDRDDQRVYLAWTRAEPEGHAALDQAQRVVLVVVDGPVERSLREDGRFRRTAADDRVAVYVRR